MIIFTFIIGLMFGSFLAAFSYRWPKGIPISKGRSFCDNCKKSLSWYDNIPLLSYVLLRGKCRQCHKPYSPRYFYIELATGLLFVMVATSRQVFIDYLPYLQRLSQFSLPVLLIVLSGFIAIFVIDWENQLIPDEVVFLLLGIALCVFVIVDFHFYSYLLAGLSASLFLLLIHAITFGRGMGLGDVKLALLMGTILGPKLSLVWIFTSFVVGGLFGLLLIISKNAKLRDKIAFGPFLIVGFALTFFVSESVFAFLFWY